MLNKKDFLKIIAEKNNITLSLAEQVYNSIFEEIKKEVKKDKVSVFGFGTFSVVAIKERTGRNPQTGKEIKIKASKKVKFTPSATFKEEVKKK